MLGFLKKRNQELPVLDMEEKDEEEYEYGVVIQITPHIIYLYWFEDGYFLLNVSSLTMKNKANGSLVQVNGDYTVIQGLKKEGIEETKEQYKLKELGLPIVEILVEEY